MDTSIDDDLRREGYARELVHAVQNARRSAGLAVEDRIELALTGDAALLEAACAHRDYIAGETLALALALPDPSAEDLAARGGAWEYLEQNEVEGRPLTSWPLHRTEKSSLPSARSAGSSPRATSSVVGEPRSQRKSTVASTLVSIGGP